MKLEVGMYIRTKDGIIARIKEIDNNERLYLNQKSIYTDDYEHDLIIDYEVIKASYNIIDLIKSKDIILGRDGKIYQCWKIYKDYVFTYSKNKQGQTITLVDYQIDKVLSKEQFEQMAYKVGE